MSQNVIQDGYTRNDGYILGVDRLFDAVEFTWRPLYGGAADYFVSDAFRLLDFDRQAHAEAKSIAQAVKTWSEVDKDGKPVPITEDSVYRLNRTLRQKLLNIVAGYAPPDLKPGVALGKQGEEDFERLLKAQTSGQSIGQVAAEADAKN